MAPGASRGFPIRAFLVINGISVVSAALCVGAMYVCSSDFKDARLAQKVAMVATVATVGYVGWPIALVDLGVVRPVERFLANRAK